MRVVVGGLNEMKSQGHQPTLILLNQLYEQITGFGHTVPVREPGGWGQIFTASVVVRMRRKAYEFADDKKLDVPPEAALNLFKVEHSKVSPPGIEGAWRMLLVPKGPLRVTDSDDAEAVVAMAQRLGVVHKKAFKWWLWDEGFESREAMAEALAADPAKLVAVGRRLIAAAYAEV